MRFHCDDIKQNDKTQSLLLVFNLIILSAIILLLIPTPMQAKDITVELVWQYPEASWLEIEPIQGEYTLDYDQMHTVLSPGSSLKIGRSTLTFFVMVNGKTAIVQDKTITLKQRKAGIIRIREGAEEWKSYRGNLSLKNDSHFWKIYNTLDQEDYLKGVVPIEMSNAWAAKGFEALKAQAVAARTYMLKNNANGIITDSPDIHQAYLGRSVEGEASRAVTATAGEILADKDSDNPISIFYSSHNGGYTELTENVWQNHDPHYTSFPDHYTTGIGGFIDQWTFSIDAEALGKAFDLAPIRELQLKKYSSGRVYRVALTDWLGNKKEVTGGEFVRAFYPQNQPLGANSFLGRLFEATYYFSPKELAPLYQQTAHLLADNTQQFSRSDGVTGPLLTRIVSSNDGIRSESCPFGSFVFSGSGWGHGVGMSQWGAYRMAMEGYTYQDILNYYYKNTEILKTVQ
ncbi:SpoIID/LytB domain-containing protein [Dehalobacter sp. DCM]|uniref:SpoIID/LytB domain-containing protein n=1 Tax=Dehalobacter sp. DCM TaxID=2907827 RepID=UPI003081C8D4|nr:SpoIID/LytB domain-containing protein [Dehalobacter sp. DCM]